MGMPEAMIYPILIDGVKFKYMVLPMVPPELTEGLMVQRVPKTHVARPSGKTRKNHIEQVIILPNWIPEEHQARVIAFEARLGDVETRTDENLFLNTLRRELVDLSFEELAAYIPWRRMYFERLLGQLERIQKLTAGHECEDHGDESVENEFTIRGVRQCIAHLQKWTGAGPEQA